MSWKRQSAAIGAVNAQLQQTRTAAAIASASIKSYTDDQRRMLDTLSQSVAGVGGFGVTKDGVNTGVALGGAISGQAIAARLEELLELRAKYAYDSSISGIKGFDFINQSLERLETFIQQFFDPMFDLRKFYAKPKGKPMVERMDEVEKEIRVQKGRSGNVWGLTTPTAGPGETINSRKSTGELP
jgi:hypothetical protein